MQIIEDRSRISFFKTATSFFKYTGLWRTNTSFRSGNLLLGFWKKLLISCFILLTIGILSGVIPSYRSGFYEKSLDSLNYGSVFCVMLYKILVITANQSEIKSLIESLESLYHKLRNKEKVVRSLRHVFLTYTFVAFLAGSINFLFMMAPVLETLTASDLESDKRRTPIQFYTPFDAEASPAYELLYAFQASMTITVVLLMSCADAIFLGFTGVCAGLFETLNDDIRSATEEHRLARVNLKSWEDELKEFIKTFVEIDKCCKQIAAIFSIFLFLHFAYNYFSLGITLLSLSVEPVFSVHFFVLLFGILCTAYDLIIYCHFGQEIITQASELQTSFYFTDWHLASKPYKQMILLTLLRTQQDINLKAGSMVPLSRSTLTTILQSAYAFFTFLEKFA